MASHSHRALRVLCVDDEPLVQQMLILTLARRGHDVTGADDGQHALRIVTEACQPFDLVITDNLMPRVSGIELAEKLRAAGYTGAIVFHSSSLRPDSLVRLAPLRIDAVVEKGRPPADLLAAVDRISGGRSDG